MKEKSYNDLSQALRALAESDATQEAAPRVEAALLQAMRKQMANATPTPTKAGIETAPQPARVLAFPALFARRKWSYALATAALLLATIGWFSWQALQTGQPSPALPESSRLATKEKTPEAPQPQPNVQTNQQAMVTDQSAKSSKPQFIAASHKGAPKRIRLNPEDIAPLEEEIATEFFPLVTQDVLPARGQVRRVQVPRSTLINFGLPVNAERLEVPIRADLIVGEDGAARAIRFVQEPYSSNPIINVYGGSPKLTPTNYRNPR